MNYFYFLLIFNKLDIIFIFKIYLSLKMEKAKNSKNLNKKKVVTKPTKINKIPIQIKNTISEKPKKLFIKRKNINNINNKPNKSITLNTLQRGKNLTKQNSNDFTLTLKSEHKNNLRNSFKKKSQQLTINKKNDLLKSKKIAITHNIFSPISLDLSSNYKKYLNQTKTKLNVKFNTIKIDSNKSYLDKFNKSNKILKNNIIFRNNKSTLNNNKLLNRSVELRNKMKKFKFNENTKVNLTKDKINNKNIIQKTQENNKENEFNNEICQTFSNKENIDILPDDKLINDNKEKNNLVNYNELKINTDYDKNIEEEEYQISKTKIYNDEKISTEFIKNKTGNREFNNNKENKKLKYLIREFCINNSYKNNIKNKVNKTSKKNNENNTNKFFNSRNEKNQLNMYENRTLTNMNNNEIFEIMSDIKVKSYNEYEKDKEKINNQNTEVKNDTKEIKNNININININYNTINVNNPNSVNDFFIEDRDEYNTVLKETFSKDRFSFKPMNSEKIKDTDLKNHENITKNRQLNKKDFIAKDDNKKEKKYIKNKEKNKYIIDDIKRLKKSLKNNANNKINEGKKKLNKFVNQKKNKK